MNQSALRVSCWLTHGFANLWLTLTLGLTSCTLAWSIWRGTTCHELTRIISRVNLVVNPNPCIEQLTFSAVNVLSLFWVLLLLLLRCIRKKNIPNIFDCNLKKDCQILIIFDSNISDTTCDQMIVQLSTAPIICFCTPWGNKINKILHFILFCLFRLSRVVQKHTFGEVGTRTIVWWQVVSKMFASKIN